MNLATYPSFVIPNHVDVCARSGRRHAHASENPTRPGTDLCGQCHQRFPMIVHDLVEYWKPLQVAHVRRPTSKDRSTFQRNAGGGEVRDVSALWNPAAAFAIAELTDWTRFLMRTVLRDRAFFGNEVLGFVDDHSTPIDVALAQLATHHARWLTEYPTLGPSLVDDVIRLRMLTMKALDQPPVRRVNMRGMFCTDVVEATDYGDVVCGAQMAGILPTDTAWSADAGPALIVCSANPSHSRIEARDWILTR